MSKAEVLIVGGGVIGSTIAYHLAKEGVRSQIIERDSLASQASGKATGVMSSPASILLFYEGHTLPKGSMQPCLKFFEEGLQRFPELSEALLEEGRIDVQYSDLPAIRVIFDEEEENYLREQVKDLKSRGLEVDWIDESDVKDRYPDVVPNVRGGVLMPGRQVEPYRFVLALVQAAEVMGAAIKQAEVTGFRYRGTKVTAAIHENGEIEADTFVLAMGPWNREGFAWLNKEFPRKVYRTENLRVEISGKLPLYRLYSATGLIVPRVDGHVMLAGHRMTRPIEECFDPTPTEGEKNKIIESAVALLPQLEKAKLVEHRSALLEWQPDGGLPMLGRVPGWDNIYVAAWMGGYGLQWSPSVGRIMTDLIIRGKTGDSIEPLLPERFCS